MSLMANLYVGQSGLMATQNALNTTAHNMSNLDTEGYTRQQVQMGTRAYQTLEKRMSRYPGSRSEPVLTTTTVSR